MTYHHGTATDIGSSLVILLGLVTLYAQTLNPFQRFNRVKRPFQTTETHDTIVLVKKFTPIVRTSVAWRAFAYYKCAWHIASNVRAGTKAKSKALEAIIHDIHRLRFNPHKPYLISGDHFNVLYPRNLGIFYHSTLDAHTALSDLDWHNRQRTYLQTVAYALETFRIYGDCTTTIVPVGPKAVCPVNIYRYPSDALYGILYGLASLSGIPGPYDHHFGEPATYTLTTTQSAQELLEEYRASITTLLATYHSRVYDARSGLVRRDIALASAKDAVLRESAFYDNVIFWKTWSLATQLGFSLPAMLDLDLLKARILDTFWSEATGHFIDDLSTEAQDGAYYSADWLVTHFTGFLDARKPEERRFLKRAIDYTIERGLDLPLPLRYQEANQSHREVLLVRLVVPAYGGSAIWSFWGAEFIKLLIVLSRYDESGAYLNRANRHIATYEDRMVRYKGYPEVYDTHGNMLRALLYKSVRQTGWVVGFEQARQLLRSIQT